MASRNLEKLIAEQAQTIADQMNKVASWAQSEEEVRHECEKLLEEFRKKAGIRPKSRLEYGLAGGRVDSVYGGVIIEYKYPKGPGKITENPKAPGTVAVIKQIKKRFDDFLTEEGTERERLFGVGCDGDTLVFVRYRGRKWDVDDPKPVTRYTVERFLRALLSLGAQGRSFSPENLVGDFGADSLAAQKGIQTLYRAICETKSKKAQTFFKQWKILFGEVCGYDVEGRNEKINKLGEHYVVPDARPAELLFAVHSYYAIFMKFLAAEIVSSFSPLGVSVVKACVGAATSAKLKREMEELEQGGIWAQLKITNFLEGDLFRWYLDAWNKDIADVVREIATKLDTYDPTTLSVEPAESRDLLKKLYQNLFPKSVRHDLGEYYTPDWLAEYVLNELGYEGDPDKRLLDPACGSGTFLVIAINRIKLWFAEHRHECGYSEDGLVQRILKNIVGFDLNPLAVMAARTNYLIAIRDLIQYATEVEIPVYLCDSVMTPAEYGVEAGGQQDILSPDGEEVIQAGKAKELKTAAGEFLIPAEIASSRELMGKYTEMLEFCVRNRYSADDFISRCKEEEVPVTEESLHRQLYIQLCKLDADNQNGIWARIMKNAFAPLFLEPVDYIAGNPPWVRYGYLPREYREQAAELWHEYGLFSLKGYEAKLGSGEKDLSQLFTYVSIDKYLKEHGLLGFLITQSVFRTGGQAEGFRRFQLGHGEKFQVLCVNDLAKIRPFEGAANLTTAFVCRKGYPTKYPVKYIEWRLKEKCKVSPDSTLSEVKNSVVHSNRFAQPVDERVNSRWIVADSKSGAPSAKAGGAGAYTARIGARTDPYGVFQLRVLERVSDNLILVENLADAGKRKLETYRTAIEDEFVYPLIRGRDAKRWSATALYHVLMVQDPEKRIGYEERWMKSNYPKTYGYLVHFQGVLLSRGSRPVKELMKVGPFYSMFAISEDTFQPYKVIWPRMGTGIRASVISTTYDPILREKLLIPCDTVTMVPFSKPDVAHYFCACMNSAPVRHWIACFSPPGRGFGSPSILKNVSINEFNASSRIHKELVQLSKSCHQTAAEAVGDLIPLESQIDRLAATLWGITEKELKAIQKAVNEMEGPKKKSPKKRRTGG